MAKRVATPDVEDDSVKKRPRKSGDSTQGGQKANNTEERAKQEHSEAEDGEELNEDEFEREHGEKIRQSIENRKRRKGDAAEFGIIEYIEMHQFMCHKFLKFNLGEQINFIIGHNGSGKSAVLSAITVGLGGKASSTGRASGIKSFIREGQNAAEVSIRLKNKGEDAFRKEVYGDSITITRRFNKEGSSTWRIRGHQDPKVISTKKEELTAICDHMDIQVDNPLNVLTQDSARQFLSASTPQLKYQFFLKGTQLAQLQDEYTICYENLTVTSKIIAQKKSALPDLKQVFEDARLRLQEASQAREQKHKIERIKKELAWAWVAEKKEEMREKLAEVARMDRRLPTIEKSIEESDLAFNQATELVVQLEAELAALGEAAELEAARDISSAELRENKLKIQQLKKEEREMQISIENLNQRIAAWDKVIAEEAKQIGTLGSRKHDEKRQKVEELRMTYESLSQQLKHLHDEQRSLTEARESATSEGKEAARANQEAQEQVSNAESRLQGLDAQDRDRLAPYGNGIDELLKKIATIKWVGERPVGPLGMYVKLKDPQTWGPLFRSHLGSLMMSFAITDDRDRSQLKHLLMSTNNSHCQIIVSQRDIFDYRHGEPPGKFPTILRVLEVSDPFVVRILINSSRIESTFIASTRQAGEAILREYGQAGVAFTCDFMKVTQYPEGGKASNTVPQLSHHDKRHQLFSDADTTVAKQHWRGKLDLANQELIRTRDAMARHRRTVEDKINALKSLEVRERQLLDQQRKTRAIQTALVEEINNETPVGISGLEEARQEALKEKESILEQFGELTAQMARINAVQQPLLVKARELSNQHKSFNARRIGVVSKIQDASTSRLEAQTAKAGWATKLEMERDTIQILKNAANDAAATFEQWTIKAEEFCPEDEVPNPRKRKDVERSLESTQKALKKREAMHGATVEEMTVEFNRARDTYVAVEKELRDVWQLNKQLRASLQKRTLAWANWRQFVALTTIGKTVFQQHLSKRGYFGKVLFNHERGTLDLKVQTDDQVATQGRDKDPRSLSGGEKSFSTICLLLALWESIGCPLRCLDEFDVFMDAVNRRISMKMLIETASASDRKQYILITPLAVNTEISPAVRVHKMKDPERGQDNMDSFMYY